MHAVRALLIPEEYGLVRGLATTTDFLRELLGGRELWPQTECGSARPNLGCQGQRHPTFAASTSGAQAGTLASDVGHRKRLCPRPLPVPVLRRTGHPHSSHALAVQAVPR